MLCYRHIGTRAGAEAAALVNYDDITPVFASQPLSAAVDHKVSDIEADGGATVCIFDCTWIICYRSWK